MFEKVLIVEDLDSIAYGIATRLQQKAGVGEVIMSQYCDDAHLKFLKAQKDNAPFDLVITDLSFKEDYRKGKIASGEQLVEKLRKYDSELTILVYSVEERPVMIRRLFEEHAINSYVIKGRKGLSKMVEAVKCLKNNGQYLSSELTTLLQKKEVFEVEKYDVTLLSHLSHGLTQEQISHNYLQKGVSPSSLSSIEKRLNRLKIELNAKTTIQLVATAKDLGLI